MNIMGNFLKLFRKWDDEIDTMTRKARVEVSKVCAKHMSEDYVDAETQELRENVRDRIKGCRAKINMPSKNKNTLIK